MASMPLISKEPPLPCPAWVYSNNSDTHVAKDRCWFGKDYIPFRSYVTDIAGGSAQVIGIGTVNIPTMSSPTETDPDSDNSVCLTNVLHAPAMLCNIIGSPMLDDYSIICDSPPSTSAGRITNKSDGCAVAYFKPITGSLSLYQIQVSHPPFGQPFGASPFCPNGLYMIHAFWSQRERHRFAFLKTSGLIRASGVEPLTEYEQDWFRKEWMTLDGILVAYGLSKDREEHRQEGRAIMRILKSHADNEARFVLHMHPC